MIEIRKCTENDFDEMLVLFRQLWPDKPIDTNALREVYKAAVSSGLRTYIAAVSGEELVGLVSLSIKTSLWQEGFVGHIEELVVHEKARGQGVGTKLLKYVFESARDHGCKRIELDSAFHRKDAHKLYEQLGFKTRAFLFSMELREAGRRGKW
jgi:glucosamine-phosphate N-acetyltransferase